MSTWIKVPPAVRLIDAFTGEPATEASYERVKDGYKAVRRDEHGSPLLRELAPYTPLVWLEKFVFVDPVFAGQRGARKVVSRLRSALAERPGEPRMLAPEAVQVDGTWWVQVEEGDADAVQAVVDAADKRNEDSKVMPWSPPMVAQLGDIIDAWAPAARSPKRPGAQAAE